MKKYSNNYIEEQAMMYALGKAKALLKLFKYKKGNLQILLKNNKITKSEFIDKIKFLKKDIENNFYKIQSMVDPTTAASFERIIHMVH